MCSRPPIPPLAPLRASVAPMLVRAPQLMVDFSALRFSFLPRRPSFDSIVELLESESTQAQDPQTSGLPMTSTQPAEIDGLVCRRVHTAG